MGTTSLVLLIVGIVLILDSLFVLVFPKVSRNLLKQILKKNNLQKIVGWELVIGIILILISVLARTP